MSFLSMTSELVGMLPKLPYDYAQTIINRAWRDVRRQNLWSFLLAEGNWTVPAAINAGTVTTTQGSSTITFDATAMAAINAVALGPPSPVTERQFRIGIGTIYNIWTYDSGTGVATLDRNYQESSGSGLTYQIYQCYYEVPVQDFWAWLSVKDMLNFNELVTTKTREWLNLRDPQRTVYYIPTHVVGYQTQQNPSGNTGRMMYELWGPPLFSLTYQLYYIRRGVDLVNDSDELPGAIGEDCVMALARAYAFEWAAANAGDHPRENGQDWRFLIGNAKSDYARLFKDYRRQDREVVDNFATQFRRSWSYPNLWGFYSSIAGSANPGAPW